MPCVILDPFRAECHRFMHISFPWIFLQAERDSVCFLDLGYICADDDFCGRFLVGSKRAELPAERRATGGAEG